MGMIFFSVLGALFAVAVFLGARSILRRIERNEPGAPGTIERNEPGPPTH